MPIVALDNVGFIGIVDDLPSHQAPLGAWTSGQNVRFHQGGVENFRGHSQVFGTPSIAPNWLLPHIVGANFFWLYAGPTKVYVTEGTSHFNITRQTAFVDVDYTGNLDLNWNGGVLTGIPILNNGVDEPQMWNPPETSQKLQALSNWPANTVAKVIRPFLNFLVALNVTKSGDTFPYMVKWSHPAVPGTVPPSWDEADPTNLAGERDLADTPGEIVDGVALRNALVIYKENSIWLMQHIGGNSVFSTRPVFREVGLMTSDCATAYGDGTRHFAVSGDDIYVHDGQNSPQSIITRKVAGHIFNSINSTNIARSYVVANYPKHEVWFCYPEQGEDTPNMAAVWNWDDNSWGFRTIPPCRFMAKGVVDPNIIDRTWDAQNTIWDDFNTAWDTKNFNPALRRVLMADGTNTKLFLADDTNQFDGVNISTFVERVGLPIVGQDRTGAPIVDTDAYKQLTAIYPRFEATTGTQVTIRSAMQDTPGGAVRYSAPQTFTIGVDYKFDVFDSGRLLGLRVESAANIHWKLTGYSLEIQKIGSF